MSKPLAERFIQHTVAERLNGEYYRRGPAYVSTEVYTKLKRADVLLSFMRARGRPYVVVVEAKSRTTIHQLKLAANRNRAEWAGRVVTAILIALLSALLGYQWYFSTYSILLLLGVFMTGSLLISAAVHGLKLKFARSISAIQQLGRYPANESWIAIGEDTFVNSSDRRVLHEQCEKSGVGLLIVDERGRMKVTLIPRPRHTFNDYLSRYGKRDEILAIIDRKPDYGPTPPERKQNRRRIFNIFLLLSLTALLVAAVYDTRGQPINDAPLDESAFGPSEKQGEAPADCPPVRLNERAYVVVESTLRSEKVDRRLAELRAAGMRGHQVISAECVELPTNKSAAIYTGKVYPSRPAAEAAAAGYRRVASQLGLSVEGVTVLRLVANTEDRR